MEARLLIVREWKYKYGKEKSGTNSVVLNWDLRYQCEFIVLIDKM